MPKAYVIWSHYHFKGLMIFFENYVERKNRRFYFNDFQTIQGHRLPRKVDETMDTFPENIHSYPSFCIRREMIHKHAPAQTHSQVRD